MSATTLRAEEPIPTPAGTTGSWLHDTAYYALGTQLPALVLLGLTLINRRILTPGEFGAFSLMRLAASYLACGRIGIEEATEREVPLARGAGDRAFEQSILEALFGAAFAQGTLGAIGGLVAAPWLVAWGLPRSTFFFLPAMALCQQAVTAYWIAYRVSGQFRPFGRALAVLSIVELATTLPLVLLFGLEGLLAGVVLNDALEIVVLHVAARRARFFEVRPTLDRAVVARLARTGLPLFLGSLVWTAYATIDSVTVAKGLGIATLGFYSFGTSVAARPAQLVSALAATFNQRLLTAVGRTGSLAAGLREAQPRLVLALGVAYPLLAATALFGASWLVRHALPRYEAELPAIQVLILGATFLPALNFPVQVLVASGRLAASAWLQAALTLAGGTAMWLAVRAGKGAIAVALVAGVMHFVAFLVLSLLAWRATPSGERVRGALPGIGALAPLAAAGAFAVERSLPGLAAAVPDAMVSVAKLAAFALAWLAVLGVAVGPRRVRGLLRSAA